MKFEIPFQLDILKKMKTDELYKLKKNIQKYKHLFFLRDKFQLELSEMNCKEKKLAQVLDVSFSDFVLEKLNQKIVD